MISTHVTLIEWHRKPHDADRKTYARRHLAYLGGDQKLRVSASAEFKGEPDCADPEQLLVNAVSSCHMLFFLAIAEISGFVADSYRDQATGYLEKVNGGIEITRIELAPMILFTGTKRPSQAEVRQMHASAHKRCFIARSVNATVIINRDAISS